MKKIFAIFTVFAAFAFVGCVKQTEISPDSLPLKCVVTGYVEYTSNTSNSSQTTTLREGTEVRVLYGIPSGSEVQYAVTTTKIDAMGGFRVDIGCPVGQALRVKCEVSFIASHHISIQSGGLRVPNEALFYGVSEEKTIPAGSAAHFKFDAVHKSNLTYPKTNN